MITFFPAREPCIDNHNGNLYETDTIESGLNEKTLTRVDILLAD